MSLFRNLKKARICDISRYLCNSSILNSKDKELNLKARTPGQIFMKPLKELYADFKIYGPDVPKETDILIVGGGVVGLSVAYWLKHLYPKFYNVVVLERDTTYSQASSVLSCGGVRHQFTIPENVQLSMYTSEFIRDIKQHLSTLDEKELPDVQFNHQGYLFLENEENAEHLEKMVDMQINVGAKVCLLSKRELKERYPWLNLAGVEVGSFGLHGEGWFDPWLLMKYLKLKALDYGVQFVSGEFTDFTISNNKTGLKRLNGAVLKTKDDAEHEIAFSLVINCAGAWAGDVIKKAANAVGDEYGIDFPVKPRKRYVYVFHSPDGPGITMPFLIDPTGVYCRREGLGGNYICGSSPAEEDEPPIDDLSVDYTFFEEAIWPQLALRVPAFEKLKLRSAWAGYYDYNEFDQNLIFGQHPIFHNFYLANGFSGHGLQHSVGVGRVLAEQIIGTEPIIDLSRFHYDRVFENKPLKEYNIV